MLPRLTIPASFAGLLECFRPCFTAPTFEMFRTLVTGQIAAPARRTVVGMLVGAGRNRDIPHDRAHAFFSRAAWSVEQVQDVAARLVVDRLVGDEDITVAMDDTLFHRRGKKVFAASWFHDGSARGETPVGHGNNWMIAGIVLPRSVFGRPLCLPVLASLVVKDTASASRLWLATRAAQHLARVFPTRKIHVVADSAYAGAELRDLPSTVTWTTRPRRDAALFAPAPPRTGKRGRPRKRGHRLGSIDQIAATAHYRTTEVTCYGRTRTVQVATTGCLWYGVFASQPVHLVLLRVPGRPPFALITTDLDATPEQIIERYASRWSIEITIEDAKQLVGVGEARNRTVTAVRRTVPFGLLAQTLAAIWYLTDGHDTADVDDAVARAPWYTTKTTPSMADALGKLRHVLITGRFNPGQPDGLTPAEIHTLRLAWDTADGGLVA